MKKIALSLMILASIAAVSCKKDNDPKTDPSSEQIDPKGDDSKDPAPSGSNASLQGSVYLPIILDAESRETLGSKIVAELGPDDNTNRLWVWEETYAGGDGAGTNFYGHTSGYTDLVVGTVGWSGAAFCDYYQSLFYEGVTYTANVDIFAKVRETIGAEPEKYYFHLAYKPVKQYVSHQLFFNWPGSAEAKFVIGDMPYEGQAPIDPVDGEFEVGEWLEYEIPVAELGINYGTTTVPAAGEGANILGFLSGGTAGTEIKIDAVFFYKK